MHARKCGRASVVGALALLCVVGCAARGDVGVWNDADATVTVRLGDEDLGEITPDGGVVLLGTRECYTDLVVIYADGSTFELDGPICPGQSLAVSNTTARIVEGTGTSASS